MKTHSIKTNGSAAVDVLELVKEEPGSLTVDEIIGSLPKSKNGAKEFIVGLIDHIKTELLEERELDEKRKVLVGKLKNTEPMRALAHLKKEIKLKKKTNSQMMLILKGARDMAKALGVDVNVKQLEA